jgi:hypothetical protein
VEQGTAFTRLKDEVEGRFQSLRRIAWRRVLGGHEGGPPQDLPLPEDVPVEG